MKPAAFHALDDEGFEFRSVVNLNGHERDILPFRLSRSRLGCSLPDPYFRQSAAGGALQNKLLPEGYERDAARIPELTLEIHYAVAGFLALTPCALWLVNQEDIAREPHQQNLPDTTAEYPNWSRKMRWSLEDLVRLVDVGPVRRGLR